MANEITLNGFKALDAFVQASKDLENDENAILRLTSTGKVATGGHYVMGNVLRRIGRDVEGNNRTREALLRSLGEAYGLNGMREENGRISFSKDFMTKLSELVGSELSVKDFEIGEDGTVSSGKPLTSRRITKILTKVKGDLEKSGSARLDDEFRKEVRIRLPGFILTDKDVADFRKDCLNFGSVKNGMEKWCSSRPGSEALLKIFDGAKKNTVSAAILEKLEQGFTSYMATRRAIVNPGFTDISEAAFKAQLAKEREWLLVFAGNMKFEGESARDAMYKDCSGTVEDLVSNIEKAVRSGAMTRKWALELLHVLTEDTADGCKSFSKAHTKDGALDKWCKFRSVEIAKLAANFHGYANGFLPASKLKKAIADCRKNLQGANFDAVFNEKLDVEKAPLKVQALKDIVKGENGGMFDDAEVIEFANDDDRQRLAHERYQASVAKGYADFKGKIDARIRFEQRAAAGKVGGAEAPSSNLVRLGVKFDAVYGLLKGRLNQMGINLGEGAKLTTRDGRLKLSLGRPISINKFTSKHKDVANGMLSTLGAVERALDDAELDVKMSVEPDGKLRFGLLVSSERIQTLIDKLQKTVREVVAGLGDDPLAAHPDLIGKERPREIDGEDKQKWLDAEAKRKAEEAKRKEEEAKRKEEEAKKPKLDIPFANIFPFANIGSLFGGKKEEPKPDAAPQVPEEFVAFNVDPSDLFADLKSQTGVGLSLHGVQLGPEGLVCSLGSGQAPKVERPVGPTMASDEAIAAEISLSGLSQQLTTAIKTLGLPLAPNGSVELKSSGNGRLKVQVRNLDKRELVGLKAGFGFANMVAQKLLGDTTKLVELEMQPVINQQKNRLELHFLGGKTDGTLGQLVLNHLGSLMSGSLGTKAAAKLGAAVKGADLIAPNSPDELAKVDGSQFALTFDLRDMLPEFAYDIVPQMNLTLENDTLRFSATKLADGQG